MATDTDRDELMVRAAWMYYHNNMTHAEIAQKLHTSRVKITRLLQRARDEGIIEIKILRPLPITFELEQRLETAFGIDRAVVAPSGRTPDESLEAVGETAANVLMELIRDGCNVGFGWSTTVSRMAPYLKPATRHKPCVISELAGSMLGQANPYSISGKVAEILGATIHPLSAPVVVQNRAARDAILSETVVHDALQSARRCEVAFVGVGDSSDASTMVVTGYLKPSEMADLRARGAVGDILMRWYDSNGQPIHTPLDECVIGLDWDDIRTIPNLVVVAAGSNKIAPLRGILRSGVCNSLVTDTDTAQAVLNAAEDLS